MALAQLTPLPPTPCWLASPPLQEVNRLAPGRADYLSMLAKQWSDLTFFHDVTTDRERQLVNLKALEYADKVGSWRCLGAERTAAACSARCSGPN